MSNYQPSITANREGTFFALVVRVDEDGYKSVITHYKARHFKTEKAALKSTTNYIAKFCA